MKPCRLKIITALISPDDEDKAEIHFVSMNQLSKNEKIEDDEVEPENPPDEIMIIRKDNSELKTPKKIIKPVKEKKYFIKDILINQKISQKNNIINSSNKNSKISTKLNSLGKNNSFNKNNYIHKRSLSKKNSKSRLLTNSYKSKIIKNKKSFNHSLNSHLYYSSDKNIISKRITDIKIFPSKELFKAPNFPQDFSFYKANKQIDNNINELFVYNKKISNLMEQEPLFIETRDNIVKNEEIKLKELIETNDNLFEENQVEINREDELKGEIIILKNQYEILANQLDQKEIKLKEYQEIIKHKYTHNESKLNKNKQLFLYFSSLNENLEKGEILLVTQPDIIYDIPLNNENNNNSFENQKLNEIVNMSSIKNDSEQSEIITLLFKGYLINLKIFDIDEIVEKIWIKEKPIQTMETLSEELILIIDNYCEGKSDLFANKKIIMNYLYSFCKNYSYISKEEFKSLFKEKIGNICEFDKNIYLNKLYHYSNNKLNDFMKLLKSMDISNCGKISYQNLESALREHNILFTNEENSENIFTNKELLNILQFIITIMKNEQLMQKNITDNAVTQVDNNKINIFDLYYINLVKMINDNYISDIPLYKLVLKQYLNDNNITSLNDFLKPLLLNNEIIINKGLNRYIENQTFYKYLVDKNVIKENEHFLLPINEDNLIEIETLTNEIDRAELNKLVPNSYQEKKINAVNEIINEL